MNLTEHAERNAQYANETDETAIVQTRPIGGDWKDLARCTAHDALRYVEAGLRVSTYRHLRVVDWITREEVTR